MPDIPVFYSPDGPDLTGAINLGGAEYRHATSVLRLGSGDSVLVADGKGRYYECKIGHLGKKNLTAQVNGMTHRDMDSEYELILAFALIKNRQRLEWMLEKATELGVAEVVLFSSDRSERNRVRLDRLQSILVSAMKQSKRYFLPRLSQCDSLADVIGKYNGCPYFVAHEKETRGPVMDDLLRPGKKVVFIGPEGGFSDDEITTLRQFQAITVSLGKNRLRAETAAIALLSKFL